MNSNSKRLLILSVVALIAVASGVWLAGQRSSSPSQASSKLYPELKGDLDRTAAVRIFDAGDELAVELSRKEDAWGVVQRAGFPADEAKIRKLLLGIADADLREEKTSNPKNYAALGVEDLSIASASGVRIELSGIDPALNLIVGKQGPGTGSRYVRKVSDTQSWLIDADLEAPASAQDWLRKSIIDVSADRIQSASVTASGQKPYSVAKQSRADANFTVEGMPKGRELSAASAPNTVGTALAALTLADVQPASAFESNPDAHATYRTFDGLAIELNGWEQDEKHFIALKTSYDLALAERFKIAAEAPKETDAKAGEDKTGEDKNSTDADAVKENAAANATPSSAKKNVADEAKSWNEKTNGWVYEIPEYKYEAIFKPLEEMLNAK